LVHVIDSIATRRISIASTCSTAKDRTKASTPTLRSLSSPFPLLPHCFCLVRPFCLEPTICFDPVSFRHWGILHFVCSLRYPLDAGVCPFLTSLPRSFRFVGLFPAEPRSSSHVVGASKTPDAVVELKKLGSGPPPSRPEEGRAAGSRPPASHRALL